MSGQKINIKIGSRSYPMTAGTPEDEERIRKAAAIINLRLQKYAEAHPTRKEDELLPFITLNEAIAHLKLREEFERIGQESDSLHAKVEDYLKHI